MLEQSKRPVIFLAEMVNVASKLIHKKGVFVVLQLTDEAIALGSLDITALKAEWPADSLEGNVKELVSQAKAKLDLENKEVEAKIKNLLDCVPEAISAGGKLLSVIQKVKSTLA